MAVSEGENHPLRAQRTSAWLQDAFVDAIEGMERACQRDGRIPGFEFVRMSTSVVFSSIFSLVPRTHSPAPRLSNLDSSLKR